jgi:serine/threonine-protein kinase ATR
VSPGALPVSKSVTSDLVLTFDRSSFESLPETHKSEILEVMGKVSCALTENLVQKPSEIGTQVTLFCHACDGEHLHLGMLPEKQVPQFEELWSICNFILPKLSRTPGPRIAAMVALKRILMHSPSSNKMHLSSSTAGEFCLHSLRSSIRELRVATGYVLDMTCPSKCANP